MPRKTLKDHESESSSWFCAVTHDLSLAENIKSSMLDFPSWAWIYHDPDSDDGTPHIHFLFSTNGTRTIKQISNKILLPANFIQVCRNVVGYRRYMLHLDNPEKIQYRTEDVHTRCHADFREAENGCVKNDVFSIYQAFQQLQLGKITPSDFIRINLVNMEKMPLSQQIKTFEILDNNYKKRLTLT